MKVFENVSVEQYFCIKENIKLDTLKMSISVLFWSWTEGLCVWSVSCIGPYVNISEAELCYIKL